MLVEFKSLSCNNGDLGKKKLSEACGLAMGLVMLGSKSATAIEEMVGVRGNWTGGAYD
ncbi:26S proteasome non-ATPase regulatory subunit 1 [Desmophyllum pertusum]|uniref:26S proteasome non-ATPase regulatory subunit 1 n=1 Tax=Desmophyllum pertusum TaxID=174260 RepID=A0A9X0CI12_9CNID|nr:26S proteasome non-ATPase regulatory subunit 1 [Desmophyllum pertusum]